MTVFARSIVLVASCAAMAACGESSTQPSPAVPAPQGPAVSTVVVTGPAGHGTSFVPGERLQLRANATYSDGAIEHCTAAAGWRSLDQRVARFTNQLPGQLEILAFGATSVSAQCGAAVAIFAVRVDQGLRISGLEAYLPLLMRDERPTLSATLVTDRGSEDCTSTARWTLECKHREGSRRVRQARARRGDNYRDVRRVLRTNGPDRRQLSLEHCCSRPRGSGDSRRALAGSRKRCRFGWPLQSRLFTRGLRIELLPRGVMRRHDTVSSGIGGPRWTPRSRWSRFPTCWW